MRGIFSRGATRSSITRTAGFARMRGSIRRSSGRPFTLPPDPTSEIRMDTSGLTTSEAKALRRAVDLWGGELVDGVLYGCALGIPPALWIVFVS